MDAIVGIPDRRGNVLRSAVVADIQHAARQQRRQLLQRHLTDHRGDRASAASAGTMRSAISASSGPPISTTFTAHSSASSSISAMKYSAGHCFISLPAPGWIRPRRRANSGCTAPRVTEMPRTTRPAPPGRCLPLISAGADGNHFDQVQQVIGNMMPLRLQAARSPSHSSATSTRRTAPHSRIPPGSGHRMRAAMERVSGVLAHADGEIEGGTACRRCRSSSSSCAVTSSAPARIGRGRTRTG